MLESTRSNRLLSWWSMSLLVLGLLLQARSAAADTNRALAADAYDAALAHYNRAEYVKAARLFLEADTLHPSAEALGNAIASARKANEHLLVAQAALRARARGAEAPELAARAREALTEAEKYLARLDLSCAPRACSLALDGEPADAGRHYVNPGSHQVVARLGNQSETESLNTSAGATYRVHLELEPGAAPSAPSSAQAERSPAAGQRPDPTPGAPATDPEPAPAHDQSARPALPPVAFYTALAVTGVAAGVTTWSGLDALKKKRELPETYSSAQRRAVLSSARRTDILLAGTAVLAAATAYIGWQLVDFDSGSMSVRASLTAGGLRASGTF